MPSKNPPALPLLLLLGAGALIIAFSLLVKPADPDTQSLTHERAMRLSAYKSGTPLPGTSATGEPLEARLSGAGFKLGAPLFVRIFKREFELEIWLKRDGRFQRFATYPICYFSGALGPKLRHGDLQSPEGIYKIEARQLNPASRWHRAFNLGFPNAFDRAHGRSGSYLMVHGGCSSVGCYAMTDPAIDDIYRLASAALTAGQPGFQVHALPFRMTEAALASRTSHAQAPFWNELKPLNDAFETTGLPPDIAICDGHYRIAPPGNSRANPLEAGCRRL